ncbi:hypothetical protein OHA77_16225 [Streptosporangium sp. NBC_01639]|uniref:hypothetical protein n=1 Tax=Streptosporangium sp. NBC_01639 TaxID=2975948 RepID=UPI003869CF9A|nr:hypothetical protein OHA77_16225 [Streptosporangium sp. NBC_01639]
MTPQAQTLTDTIRYGIAHTQARDRLRPLLTCRAAWESFPTELPIVEGAVIRSQVDHLPSGGGPKPAGPQRPIRGVGVVRQAVRSDLRPTPASGESGD